MIAQAAQTHYDVLGVEPGASQTQIEDAYLERRASWRSGGDGSGDRWALERAYVTLRDRETRRRYDEEQGLRGEPQASATKALARSRSRPGRKRVSPALVLAILGAVLALGLWRVTWPFLAWRFVSYSPGAALVTRASGTPFGTVLAAADTHVFPGHPPRAAYLVKLASGEERWLPREEVNHVAREER